MIDFVTNVQIRGRMYSLFGKLENPKKSTRNTGRKVKRQKSRNSRRDDFIYNA